MFSSGRSAITNEKLPDDIDWQGVWHLAQKHHLEGIIYLSEKDTIKAEMSKKLPGSCRDSIAGTFCDENRMVADRNPNTVCYTKRRDITLA